MIAQFAPNSELIRTLNDRFRQSFLGGKVVITQGIDAHPALKAARTELPDSLKVL